MAIRGNKEESFLVSSDINTVRLVSLQALQAGKFKNIDDNRVVNQITADYRSISLYGSIRITLEPEGNNGTRMRIIATANVDNIYNLFSSATQRIIDKFKENIKYKL